MFIQVVVKGIDIYAQCMYREMDTLSEITVVGSKHLVIIAII